MKADAFRYDGKRAVVVGGATGMGAATAELVQDLGAEVVVMDYAPVTLEGVKAIKVNLTDKASIDAAVDECGGPIHALFSCAGVADGTPGIEKVNFIGHRHFIDRAIEKGYLGRGSAIGMISSTAGLGWRTNMELVQEYLATPDFDAAAAWIEAHPEHGRLHVQQAGHQRVRGQPGVPVAAAGHPHQRDPARPDRHAAGPRERRHLARLRHRLPRATPASRRRRPTSRPVRSRSSAATPPATSTARS